jgi:hypothetical protein
MSREYRWLGVILPNLCIAVTLPWSVVGLAGSIFSVLFLVMVWVFVEAFNHLRSRKQSTIPNEILKFVARYERKLIFLIVSIWTLVLLFAVLILIKFKMPLGALIEANWSTLRSNPLTLLLIAKLPLFLFLISGLIVGLSFDAAREKQS